MATQINLKRTNLSWEHDSLKSLVLTYGEPIYNNQEQSLVIGNQEQTQTQNLSRFYSMPANTVKDDLIYFTGSNISGLSTEETATISDVDLEFYPQSGYMYNALWVAHKQTSSQMQIIVGQTYKIKTQFDNLEHSCVVQQVTINGNIAVLFGNQHIIDSSRPDTSEPFVYVQKLLYTHDGNSSMLSDLWITRQSWEQPSSGYHKAIKVNYLTGKFIVNQQINSKYITNNNVENADPAASTVEGKLNVVTGQASHAEGVNNVVTHRGAHAEGIGNKSGEDYQHVGGKFNVATTGPVVIGGGTSPTYTKNIYELDWEGNGKYSGSVTAPGGFIGNATSASQLAAVDSLVVENSFTKQTTSGSENITNGVANIKAVKGKTIDWNQLITHSAAVSATTLNGLTFTDNANGSFTLNGTTTADTSYVLRSYEFKRSSKVLLTKLNSDSNIQLDQISTISIQQLPVGNHNFTLNISKGTTLTNVIVWPMAIDLSRMFGYDDSCVPTLLQFMKLYPIKYYEPVESKIIHFKSTGIITTRLNQWDEIWEKGKYNDSGDKITSSSDIRSKNYIEVFNSTQYYLTSPTPSADVCFYDGNKNFISKTSVVNQFTTPELCYYIRFSVPVSTYSNNICLIIMWTGKNNGKYAKYEKTITNLPFLTYFPSGMKSINQICDELTPTSSTQRISSLSLKNLSWTYISDVNHERMVSSKVDQIVTCGNSEIANALWVNSATTFAQAVSQQCVYNHSYNNIFGINNDGCIEYYSTTMGQDASQFKKNLNNHTLYFQLKDPITTLIDPSFDNYYYCEDYGTEQWAYSDASSISVAPMSTISYVRNLIDEVRNMREIFNERIDLKVDKVEGAGNNNFAIFDETGNIKDSGFSGESTATTSTAGLMSSEDKIRLNNVSSLLLAPGKLVQLDFDAPNVIDLGMGRRTYRVITSDDGVATLMSMYAVSNVAYGATNSYTNSTIHQELNTNFYQLLPEYIKSEIIPVNYNQFTYIRSEDSYSQDSHASYARYTSKTVKEFLPSISIYSPSVEMVEEFFGKTFSLEQLLEFFYYDPTTIPASTTDWLSSGRTILNSSNNDESSNVYKIYSSSGIDTSIVTSSGYIRAVFKIDLQNIRWSPTDKDAVQYYNCDLMGPSSIRELLNVPTTAIATTTSAGLLSADDKDKLDNIASGAEANVSGYSIIKVGSTSIPATIIQDTLTLTAGSNVTLTPSVSNKAIQISAKDTTYNEATQSSSGLMSTDDKKKLDGIATGATSVTSETVSKWGFIQSATNTTYTLTQNASDGHIITLTPSSGSPTTITIPDNNTVTTVSVTGSGNAITSISASNGAIIATKGDSFLTSHQDISSKSDVSETGYSLSASGQTVQLKNKSGTVMSTITTQDTWRGIQDNLTSTSTSDSLSAYQGKLLNDALSGKAASSHTHTKSQVGLDKVDNTADADKSVSFATRSTYANSAYISTPGLATLKNIIASTTDLTAGTSELTTGQIYLVYE